MISKDMLINFWPEIDGLSFYGPFISTYIFIAIIQNGPHFLLMLKSSLIPINCYILVYKMTSITLSQVITCCNALSLTTITYLLKNKYLYERTPASILRPYIINLVIIFIRKPFRYNIYEREFLRENRYLHQVA